jgi:hypothetical protein
MTHETIYYLGLLGNAHPLLEHINLPSGIRFEQIRYDNLIELLSLLRRVSTFDIGGELLGQNISYPPNGGGQLHEMCSIVVTGSFTGELEWTGDDIRLLSKFPNEALQFDNEIVQKIINPTLSLIRIGRACNIQKFIDYYYVVDEGRPTLITARYSSKDIFTEYLSLKEEDISILQLFLNSHTLPPKTAFVQQALDIFELAYSITNSGVSFILLITCLEVLFEAGAHKVARNAAVLLSKDESSAQSIFMEVKRLHKLRSEVLHSGKLTKVKWADVNSLRNVAREAIRHLFNVNLDKERFLEDLNRFGFADQARVHALLTSS